MTSTHLQAKFAIVTRQNPSLVQYGTVETTQRCQHIADDQTAFIMTLEHRFGAIKHLYLVIRNK